MKAIDEFLKYIESQFPNLFQGVGAGVVLWILAGVAAVVGFVFGALRHRKNRKSKKKKVNINLDKTAIEDEHIYAKMTEPVSRCSHILLPEPNLHYFERDEYYEQLQEAFKNQTAGSRKQILSGMGGVGKTQIALGFAYKSISIGQYRNGVFWISGESKDTVRKGLLSIAEELGMSDRNSRNVEIRRIANALKQWFSANSDWLLIVDNTNKDNYHTDFLPNNPLGHVLFVTQVSRLGKQQQMPVDVFSEFDAKRFMRVRLDSRFGDDESLSKLVIRLGFFPLAIEQSITYMLHTGMPFDEYLSLLDKHGLRAFNEKNAQLSDYKHVVTTTWRISFARLEKKSTQQLFSLCAYMAAESIPIELFKRQNRFLPYPLKKTINDELLFGKVLADLQSYSLVNRSGNFLNIHGMVQEAMRMQLERRRNLIFRWIWLNRSLKIVASDKQQFDERVKEQRINLKEQFEWCVQMKAHIACVKEMAERQEVKSVPIKAMLHKDFNTWVTWLRL